ncbi:hypothetical protein [Ruminococcus flavefaciens]|uniref:LPXTG-motif cell wall anchor domain-containing protein n=1 Tax=Ruminococcus flavefaciens TaxID=1265 RepID=A0A1M7LTZ1_RUMFL|nr:hypothetical protein [Ruminococcus flavefaciens]SHM81193.1 hypothetical protein SAMN04487860_11545 [Ruminococcus flavefaciens]
MRAKKLFASLVSSLLLLNHVNIMTAFAEVVLPEGAVKGLPERLAALDSEGRSVNSATGEYFFHVENMKYGETYSKEVQLMNLRDDEAYNIYFYVEPLFKNGEIDLEKGCQCTFYLDNKEFYKGDVNGKGNIDLSQTYYDTGRYNPGDSHVLRAEVVWNDIDVIQNVDNGHKLVDANGTHVLTGPNSSGYAEGEIEFKWIFFASVIPISGYEVTTAPASTTVNASDITTTTTAVSTTAGGSSLSTDESSQTVTTTVSKSIFNTPFTGYLAKEGKIWLISIGVISAMIVFLLVLIHKDRKKREKK